MIAVKMEMIKTETPAATDVWMINSCLHFHSWWFERVIFWEGDVELEYAVFVRAVLLRMRN